MASNARILACVLLAVLVSAAWSATAFTYQGLLHDGAAPAGGVYDFRAKLFDAVTAGKQIGGTLTFENVTVAGGVFTISPDFGGNAFGGDRWLELYIRPGASTGAFTMLAPRQRITPAPNAVYAATVPWSGVAGAPNIPPVALVSARRLGIWGEVAGFEVDAAESYDVDGGPVSYAWDTAGDGVFAAFGPTAQARFSLDMSEGYRMPVVRVRDAGGLVAEGKTLARSTVLAPSLWASADNAVTVAATAINGVPGVFYTNGLQAYLARNVGTDIAGPWSKGIAAAITTAGQPLAPGTAAGKPAVATIVRDLPTLFVAGAADGTGTWTGITPTAGTAYASAGWRVTALACATVAGRPALAFYESAQGDLWFAIAANGDGGGPWSFTAVETTGTVGQHPSLAVVGGCPAIAYLGPAGVLRYAVNAAADGAGAWTVADVEAAASQPTLLEVAGAPTIIYAGTGGIRHARLANGVWNARLVAAHTPATTTGAARSLVAAVVDGAPAAAVVVSTATGNALRYLAATTPESTVWGDVALDTRSHPAANVALGAANARPVVAYVNGDTGRLQVVMRPY